MDRKYYAVEEALANQDVIEIKVGGPLPRLDREDQVVVFRKEGERILFVGRTQVLDHRDVPDSKLAHVALEEVTAFDEPVDLREVGGTMYKIERILTPEWHFRRPIVGLVEWDFETIVERRVDDSRTLFRYLFASLPIGLKGEFLSLYRDTTGLGITGVIDTYGELAPALLNFVEDRLGTTFDLMERLRDMHSRIEIPDLPRFDELVLGSEDVTSSDVPIGRIVERVLRFKSDSALFGTGQEEPLFDVWRGMLNEGWSFEGWKDNVR